MLFHILTSSRRYSCQGLAYSRLCRGPDVHRITAVILATSGQVCQSTLRGQQRTFLEVIIAEEDKTTVHQIHSTESNPYSADGGRFGCTFMPSFTSLYAVDPSSSFSCVPLHDPPQYRSFVRATQATPVSSYLHRFTPIDV